MKILKKLYQSKFKLNIQNSNDENKNFTTNIS